jgi:signal transduction histidine kinase/ligand-binding sensor domain-containing protein/DNA-binding response OmpR family regulator
MDSFPIKDRVQIFKKYFLLYYTLLYFIPAIIYSQDARLRFEHLTVKDGLPENCVGAIFQDHLGFLWFGTTLGLAQFDGYQTTVYKFESDYPSVGNHINIISEDKDGNLWIASWSGLRKFVRKTKNFEIYPHTSKNLFPTQGIINLLIDSGGMIWIVTYENKLFRFNPVTSEFKYFNTLGVPADQTTQLSRDKWYDWLLDGNLLEDDLGDIWFGSASKGLFYIPKGTDKIQAFKHNESDENSISSDSIVYIHQDTDGIIWIATMGGGLNSFDKKTKKFLLYKHSADNPNSLVDDRVFGVYEDKYCQLWISTFGGIDILDRKKGIIKHLKSDLKNKVHTIFPIFEDDKENIWMLDYRMGSVVFYDRKTGIFKHYRNIPDDPNSFKAGNELWSYLIDRTNILWVGTWGGAANKLDLGNQGFKKFFPNNQQYEFVRNQERGNVLVVDASRSLILGSYGKGLHIFNPGGELLKSFKHNPLDPNSISSDYVTALYMDRDGILWVGTIDPKFDSVPVLNKYDKLKDNFHRFPITNSKIEWLNRIFNIYKDQSGKYWIGTRIGFYEFIEDKSSFNFYQVDSITSPIYNRVDAIIEDKQQRLWIGTDGLGLVEFDKKSIKFKRYLGNESILAIVKDTSEKLWLGSLASGLILFDPETGQSDFISKKMGLSNLVIVGMLSDNENNIWISTKNGLLKYNTHTKSFRFYDEADGLYVKEFYMHANYIDMSGRMYFEGVEDFIKFFPDEIRDDPSPPNIVITDLSLFNRPGEKLEFEKDITDLKEIELSYNQNDIHLEFIALHYSYPANNKYKYKLKNFDNDWIDAGNLRSATYTNLDPGEYIFQVKGSNCDGIWNEAGTSLKIIINPPLWATTWAYLFYIILFGSILYYAWRMQLKRVRVKHEFEMSKFEAQKLHEVDEMKSRFFANISHEFRTPLTLILGPVKQMIERTKETKTRDDLNLVQRNANRLLGLVNQLLDISKIESGNMKLQTAPINVIPYLKALVLSFTSYAERKRISLNFVSDVNEIIVYVDKDKFEKIINNILSNAFKFTPDDGAIKIIVNLNNNNLRIAVSDTGVGIPKEKLQKIFDRFYQVDGSHTREQEGTGIGLSLTKELVELHKGNIEVESEEGKGSSFITSLPLGTDHLKPDEIVELELEKTEHPITESMLTDTPVNKTKLPEMDFITQADKPILLIVEDNYDVRNYIRNNLNNGYKILEAVDGEDGWNKSTNNLPDLIVSDVMMPKMDGFELCKRIKTDERTSHIPVILLTAKAAKQDKLDGYEIGADDYIMKPFEPDELSARIKNLIIQRKKLQEHFKKNGVVDFKQSHITSVDKKFLQKVLDRIAQHISDSSFSVELLSEDLGISRSVVHRKILSLTGETPGDLIRRIRLNKAAELIQKKFGNLSEIALEVGFNNPAHFSESFKKQFGISPSHYQ